MGGRPLLPLTLPARAQDDLSALIASALDAVSASALLREALQGGALSIAPADCYTLVAAGKASAAMLERWDALVSTRPARAIGVGTHDQRRVPDHVEWFTGGHPTPTPSSLAAAAAVLAAAAAVPP
ncbi:MAG: DUF4147 domain-containing protein, partial [Luteitalea sp.]